jgi:hypothetical protein
MDFSLLSPEDFEQLCMALLKAEGFTVEIVHDRRIRADFVASHPPGGQELLVECTTAQLLPILRQKASDLTAAQRMASVRSGLLMLARQLDEKTLNRVKQTFSVDIWDPKKLLDLLEKHPDVATPFEALIKSRLQIRERSTEPIGPGVGRELIQRLNRLAPGSETWRQYEDICVEILNYVFIPPLRQPRIQARSEDGLDRRDAIYPIGWGHPFWDSIRMHFGARLVVAEFKNHTEMLGQTEVESIAQYLYPKAMRSFGFLCGRQGASENAYRARRRTWQISDSLIVILADDDLAELLRMRDDGEEPSELLEEQIDEFFVGLAP